MTPAVPAMAPPLLYSREKADRADNPGSHGDPGMKSEWGCTMVRRNLAVLFVASMLVAASAVTTADAGVGGCRGLGCGGWQSLQAPITKVNPTDTVLSSLSFFVPRSIIESFRLVISGRGSQAPAKAPTTGATIEGVGGCRSLGCGGWQ